MQPLDEATLDLVAGTFDLGVIRMHWPATRGIENRNFFLSTTRAGIESEYVLTIMESPASSGSAVVPLLDACVAAGLPVPAAVRTREGANGIILAGKPAMVCPRLPGRHVVNPTITQVAAVGRFLARLHTCTSRMAPTLAPYPRTVEWLRTTANGCRGHLPWLSQRLLQDALDDVESLLRRTDIAALPTGAIHGDLFRDNVLFDRWGLSGVLDFHHAARGLLIYDLAVAANDWCAEPNGAMDSGRLQALLAGYHGIRPLHPQELWQLPPVMLYAGLAFWVSRLAVAIEQRRGRADRANDPRAFERVVAERIGNPVRIDAWALAGELDQKVAESER